MRILFLSHFLPHPPTSGAALRDYNILKELSRHHEVHLLAFSRPVMHPDSVSVAESRKHLLEFCRTVEVLSLPTDRSRFRLYSLLLLNLLSSAAYSTWQFRSRKMRRALSVAITRHEFDVVHVDTIAMAGYCRHFKKLPAVLNHHNIESQLLRRRAGATRNRMLRFYINLQSRRLARTECEAAVAAADNVCVSEIDRAELLRACHEASCRVVPNGTDLGFFQPQTVEEDHPPSLVFVGSMTWFPNAQGMQRFAELIWPRIKAAIPETVIYSIGAHPPEELRRLAERDTDFRVLGFIDDIRPYVARAAVYVVPIHVGGGTRVKILDAMAMAKAIVSHPVGAEGLEVTHGKDLLIAEEPEEFADAVVSLITNPELRKRLGRNARDTVEAKYAWPRIVPLLESIYREAAAGATRPAADMGRRSLKQW